MGAPPSAGTVLQLVENAPHAAWGECLNVQVPWYGDAHPASQVSRCRAYAVRSSPAASSAYGQRNSMPPEACPQPAF